MTSFGPITSAVVSPFPDDEFKPTARLHEYDDGQTIAALEFAPHGRATVNLGQLDDAQAVAYLRHVATQALELAYAIEARKAVTA